MDFPGISPANYESVEYYAILGDYLPKEINVLRTYPGGGMPYIILLVHCDWTCAKVVLSGSIAIISVLKMMSMLMLLFVVFVRIHHHCVSNKAFCSKKKKNLLNYWSTNHC